jgi:hypothetical protein
VKWLQDQGTMEELNTTGSVASWSQMTLKSNIISPRINGPISWWWS